jgi:hypothetical protein
MADPLTLYHYTAPATSHLGSILEEGRLTLSESNLSFETQNAGPRVVWLTDSTDAAAQVWATGPTMDQDGEETTDPTILPSAMTTMNIYTGLDDDGLGNADEFDEILAAGTLRGGAD